MGVLARMIFDNTSDRIPRCRKAINHQLRTRHSSECHTRDDARIYNALPGS
jgi:hypothetical protein